MRKHIEHLLHTDRVHLTAIYGVIIALALLGLDLSLAGVVQAPTLLGIKLPGTSASSTPSTVYYQYLEVMDSCGPYFNNAPCVNMRSGPGAEFPVVLKLRTGVVLEVSSTVTDKNGRNWYKIKPDQNIRYPERITSAWYVAADLVHLFNDDGTHELNVTVHRQPNG